MRSPAFLSSPLSHTPSRYDIFYKQRPSSRTPDKRSNRNPSPQKQAWPLTHLPFLLLSPLVSSCPVSLSPARQGETGEGGLQQGSSSSFTFDRSPDGAGKTWQDARQLLSPSEERKKQKGSPRFRCSRPFPQFFRCFIVVFSTIALSSHPPSCYSLTFPPCCH